MTFKVISHAEVEDEVYLKPIIGKGELNMRRILLTLSLSLLLVNAASARGIYNNNVLYNLDNVLTVSIHSSNIVSIKYINGSMECIKFKSKAEAKKFFGDVSAVML